MQSVKLFRVVGLMGFAKKFGLCGLFLLMANCATHSTHGREESRADLPPKAIFADQLGREYIFDFEKERAGLRAGHSGVVLIDCSNEKFKCIQGDVVIAAPVNCKIEIDNGVWKVNDAISYNLVAKESKDGNLFFERKNRSGMYEGIKFKEKDGVVSFWISQDSRLNNREINEYAIKGRQGLYHCN